MNNRMNELRNGPQEPAPALRPYEEVPILARLLPLLDGMTPEEKIHVENTLDSILTTKERMRVAADKCKKHVHIIEVLTETVENTNGVIAILEKTEIFDKMAVYLSNGTPAQQAEYCETKAMTYLRDYMFFEEKKREMQNNLIEDTPEQIELRRRDEWTYAAKMNVARNLLVHFGGIQESIVRNLKLLVEIPFVKYTLKSCTDEQVKKAIILIPVVKKAVQSVHQSNRNRGKGNKSGKQAGSGKKNDDYANFQSMMEKFTAAYRRSALFTHEDLLEMIRVRNDGAMKHYMYMKAKIEAEDHAIGRYTLGDLNKLAVLHIEKSVALEWFSLITEEAVAHDALVDKTIELKAFFKACMNMEYDWLCQMKASGKITDFPRPVIPGKCRYVNRNVNEMVYLRSIQQRAFKASVHYFALEVNPHRTEGLTFIEQEGAPDEPQEEQASPEPERRVPKAPGNRRRARGPRVPLVPTVQERPIDYFNDV